MKKTMKNIAEFSIGSIALGGMGTAVASAGGDASGLAKVSSMMPAMGSLMMAGNVLRMTKELAPMKRRKRR